MILPGVVVVFAGLFLINRLTDTPQSLGLPPIEKYRSDYPDEKSKEEERELSTREILFKYVLTNPYIWLLGVSYFFVYIIRNAVNHWTVIYLVEQKSYNTVAAAAILAWFEIGGIAGSLFAGWSSDKIFKGNRGPVNVLYCLFSTAAIALFWFASGITVLFDSIMIFSIGFLIFGPQMLIGVAAVEISHKKAAATATGLTGWIAYLGVAASGYPLGRIIQDFSWEGYFIALSICGLISTSLLLPLWNAKVAKEKAMAKETIS
jgi:OPA family sugar phosphate sensor protein UhpC-like MFS transporter